MSDRTFAQKKTNTTNFAQPSLVSSTTPTLANPTRGFGLTNNVIQKAADTSTEQQEIQNADQGSSLEQQTIQEKPLTHDISRISFRRPQGKLTVGEPGDQYEQEADWVANRIMRMAIPNQVNTAGQPGENLLQRKCAACEEEEKLENIQTDSIVQRDEISDLPPVPNYQLTPPSLLQPPDPGSRYRLGGDMSLHLDPQFQVMMQQVQQQVNPSTVRNGLAQVNLQLPTSSIPTSATPNPFALPSTSAASTPAPATEEPTTTRAGTSGDILRAVLRMPEIDRAVTSLQTQVGDRVTRDWQRLNTGETIATVSTLVAIGGGALAGIISDPSARRFALDQLNGRTIPVPYLNWLNLEVNTGSDNLMLGLHVDVGRLLPPSWGFKGSDPSAIGGPPQPEPLPGMIQRQIDSEGNIQTSTDLESRLNSSKGGGSPLGDTVRNFMEPRFGADFSSVRVHTDNTAVQMNRELGAQAFTHGSDVYFGAGKAPGNNELTAHELTHVVQQGATPDIQHQSANKIGKAHIQNEEVRMRLVSNVVQLWPGDGMLPPGDCGWANYLGLRGAVETAKAIVSTLGSCSAGDSCLFLATKIAAITAEIAARVALDTTCFKGGDTGHRQQVQDKINMLSRCYRFFNQSNCPPELIAAMAVVVERAREVVAAAAVAVTIALVVALIVAIIALVKVIAALAAALAAAAEAAAAAAAVMAVLTLILNQISSENPETT